MGKTTSSGRSKGSFIKLDDWLTRSAAWQDLRGNSVKLLIHLMKLAQGNNGWGHREKGGQLFCSESTAASVICVARNTASAAFIDLIDHGFLRVVQAGHFRVKVRHATVWRLTFQPYPFGKMGPTNEWRNWKPEENPRAQKLNTSGAKIEQLSNDQAFTGAKTDPDNSGIGGNAEKLNCLKTAPHLDMPGAVGQRGAAWVVAGGGPGWWTADRLVGPASAFIAILSSANHPAAQNDLSKEMGSSEICCADCGDRLVGGRRDRRYCDEACRKRSEKKRYGRRTRAAA